jgi:Protein of unknown function (DUF1552)
MFITKKHLDRRTFLRGMAGAGIALPLLDAMIPAAVAQALTAARPQMRAAFVYTPHGVILSEWVPKATGKGYQMTSILSPLEPYRDRFTIFSNLALNPKNTAGSGHASASATWLSSAVAKDTKGADVESGTTIDQMIAAKIGHDTPLPSLELGIEDTSNMVGVCDGTSSCGYLNTISWRTPTQPLPMEINPRVVFERMFGDGSSPEQRAARARADRSLLDSVTRSAAKLQRTLGGADRARVSNYLENVREVERRIANLEKRNSDERLDVPDAPVEIPQLYDDHVNLMFDLQVLAFQTDMTRVSTFMMSRELNNRTYPQIGIADQHHAISHHGNKPEKVAQHAKINTYHVGLFAGFLDRLAKTTDGDGSLLDHMMILYGSGMGEGNVHSHDPISNLLVGGATARIKGGQHIQSPPSTPMANLLLTMLHKAEIEAPGIGDSTGTFDV